MISPIKQQLITALSLPGFEDWRPDVDVPELNRPFSRPEELPGSGRIAAVMVLIYPASVENVPGNDIPHDDIPQNDVLVKNGLDDSTLVLTKRNANLSKHASQISFPGGRQEAGESLQETALRETQEEIGIEANEIEVIGQLNSVYIPPTDFVVTPFVGWHGGQPSFVRCEHEVEQIIEAPLVELLQPTTLVFGDIVSSSGRKLHVPFYQVDEHKVWGATAIMLGELIERLSRIAPGVG